MKLQRTSVYTLYSDSLILNILLHLLFILTVCVHTHPTYTQLFAEPFESKLHTSCFFTT